MFGKLTLDSFPFHEPIIVVTVSIILLAGLAVVAGLTYFQKWGYLWSEWLTSVDHKKIGVMYIFVAMLMLVRGFADAIMMRTQALKSVVDMARVSNFMPEKPLPL